MKTIDARNLSCPQPVILTKNAIESNAKNLLIIVDNQASCENVKRFLTSQNYSVEENMISESHFELTATSPDKEHSESTQNEANNNRQTNKSSVIYITDNKVGPDAELGELLLKSFIHTIKECEALPTHIIFVNQGVFATCKIKETIEDLLLLEKKGIKIFSCGTCLNYYNLTEKLQVGSIGNAYDTMDILLKSDSVIRL